MGAEVNMRRCVMDGLDREIVVHNRAGTECSELIHGYVPVSLPIHKKSRSSQRSIGKLRKLIAHFMWLIIQVPNKMLF